MLQAQVIPCWLHENALTNGILETDAQNRSIEWCPLRNDIKLQINIA
jgi:hypothetical protein